MAITKHSPHLALSLKRNLADLNSGLIIEQAFDYSIEHGGLEEIDFKREPGASYNPRPARIALILITDLDIFDPEIISAALLASVSPNDSQEMELRRIFSERVVSLARSSNMEPKKIAHSGEGSNPEVSAICSALYLDRARHLHQSNPQEVDWKAFLNDAEQVIELAKPHAPAVANRLIHWKNAFERRHRELIAEIA